MPAFQSWAEIYREHGHEIPMDKWSDYVGRDHGFSPADHLAALVGEGLDVAALRARRDARKNELVLALDVMDGVRDYIIDAKRLGLRLGIASSSPRAWVVGHLERLGIHAHWDAIRTSDDVTRTKPAPDLYRAAIEALAVAPHEAVAFEDSPHGITAAKAAGLRCVAVPNPLTAGMDLSAADMRLGSLAAMPLRSLLEALARD